MWGRPAWGAAVAWSLSTIGCTVLFPFGPAPAVDRPVDGDGVADAGPADPDRCGTVVTTIELPGAALGAEVVFDQVLAAYEGGGVQLLDVADPDGPLAGETFLLDHPSGGLDVSLCPRCEPDRNGRTPVTIYVSDDSGLEVLSTLDGLHPIALLAASEAPIDTAANRAGDQALASFGDGRISVLEVGNVRPGLPEVVELSEGEQVVRAPCAAPRLAILETGIAAALVAGDGCGPALWIFDSGGGSSLEPVTVPLGVESLDLAQAGDHALLIAAGPAGLLHVDVADPARPVLTTVPLPHAAVAVAAFATNALVAGDGALMVVDLSDLDEPRVVGDVPLAGEPRSVGATRTAAFVALGEGGLAVVDIGCWVAPDGPLWDGRGEVGGEGEGEGTPLPGPTPCEPPQIAVESVDGRLQCAPGCRTIPLGNVTWCTTDCTNDAQCMGASVFCERESDVCVHGCQTDEQCHDVGLHRCTPIDDYCI